MTASDAQISVPRGLRRAVCAVLRAKKQIITAMAAVRAAAGFFTTLCTLGHEEREREREDTKETVVDGGRARPRPRDRSPERESGWSDGTSADPTYVRTNGPIDDTAADALEKRRRKERRMKQARDDNCVHVGGEEGEGERENGKDCARERERGRERERWMEQASARMRETKKEEGKIHGTRGNFVVSMNEIYLASERMLHASGRLSDVPRSTVSPPGLPSFFLRLTLSLSLPLSVLLLPPRRSHVYILRLAALLSPSPSVGHFVKTKA